jgi:hypothetical protein
MNDALAFVRWKQKCFCSYAALLDERAAVFLLDERVPLADRFEISVRILDTEQATARTLQ